MSPAQKQKAYRERKAAAARVTADSNAATQPGQPFTVTPPADQLPATPAAPDPFDLYADDDTPSSPPAPARTSLLATPATPATQPPPATPAPTSHTSTATPSTPAAPSSEAAPSSAQHEKQAPSVSVAKQGAAKPEKIKGNAAVTGGAEGAGIAANEGSSVTRTRGPIVAGSPRYFDLLPLDPVPGDVFDRCCVRLARGDNWPDIANDEAIGPRELWQRCGKYAHLNPDNAPKWAAACHAETDNHRRDVATIHARALAAGFDGVRKKKRTKTGADGKTETEETEEQYADPSMIRIALETADPATYGRGAGRQSPVTVNTTNAAFFGGTPPPGNLSGRFDD